MENGNKPATKKDLAELEQRLRGATKQDMASLEERLRETIHDAETNLLKAFYGFAESTRKQMADLTMSDTGIRERLETLENRLLEIEKRLNMPPSS